MPNQPRADNPARAVRVPDELWHAAQAAAAEQGTTVSVVIREALERLVLSAVGRRVNESAPRPRERPRG